MLDIIIVGAGTAGLSAAIYGLRAGKSVLLFDGSSYGGQIVNTPDIENYPGIKHISGYDFATGLYQQAKDLGAELRIEKVLSIEDLGQTKKVRTTGGEYATGARNRELGLPNEKALVGRGLSYCATCDGMFFRNRIVAVNGGGNTAVEDAFFLSNYVKKVYLIHRRDAFRAAEKDLERLRKRENVEFILNTTISALKENEGGLCALELKDKEGAERESFRWTDSSLPSGRARTTRPSPPWWSWMRRGILWPGRTASPGQPGSLPRETAGRRQ